jgi:hypothetical protein
LWIGGIFSQDNVEQLVQSTVQAVFPKPNGVVLHLYQDDTFTTEQILSRIVAQNPGLELCMGEWNWQGGTKEEFKQYQRVLNKYTTHSFYFCENDGMVPNYGLRTAIGYRKPEFHNYVAALTEV